MVKQDPSGNGKHYHLTEITGENGTVDSAIDTALAGAATHHKNLRWFEVVSIRGRITNQAKDAVQVTLKVGFEDDH